jgi:hypothetical protein
MAFMGIKAFAGRLAKKDEKLFIKTYDDALSTGTINVEDIEMINSLKDITKAFTKDNVIDILKKSCEYADTYKTMGTILCTFCRSLEDNASIYIEEGDN